MDIFLLVLRLLLAGVFGVSGIAKLLDREGAEKAFGGFGVPSPLSKVLAYLLPALEIAIAVSLIFVQTSRYGAIAAAGLLLIFSAAMLYHLARGNAPDCHCFGQLHSEPVGVASIVRNIILLIPAGMLSVQPQTAQGLSLVNSSQEALIVGLGIVILSLLVVIAVSVRTIAKGQADLSARVELFEFTGAASRPVEREGIGHPREGLPIGALAPEFALPDVDGKKSSLSDLKAADPRAILFVFISPTCTPCKALSQEFDKWEKELSEKVRFIYISDRTPEENRKKFGESSRKTILIQNKREVAELFRAKWTPMAVLINAKGRIVSFTAAGDVGLRRLIEEIRRGNTLHPLAYFAGQDYPTLTRIRIGEEVPKLTGHDIAGVPFATADLKGKQTLLTFWSADCQYCSQMLDDLREWDHSKNGLDPELVLFIGDKDDDAKQLGLKSRIVVDPGHDLGDQLGQASSPSAILVDEEGRYISETAVGAEDIWALVGKRP